MSQAVQAFVVAIVVVAAAIYAIRSAWLSLRQLKRGSATRHACAGCAASGSSCSADACAACSLSAATIARLQAVNQTPR